MYKKHNSFSFIALLFMPRLSEHERSGAIGMLKAGVRFSDVARYHNCHTSTIQRLRDRYQATGTVKDRRRSGQPRMATGVKSQNYCVSTIFTSTISVPVGYRHGQINSRAPRVIYFWVFNKKYFITIT